MENIGRLISIIQRRMGGNHISAEIFHIQAVTKSGENGYDTKVTAQLSVFNDEAGLPSDFFTRYSLMRDEKLGWFDLELKMDNLFINGRKVTLLPCKNAGRLEKITQNNQVLGYSAIEAICTNRDPRDRPYFFPKKWSDLKGGYNEDVDWDPILFPGTMFKEQHPENEGGGETILCMAMRRYDGYWNSDWFTLREFDKDGKETTDWGRDYPKRKNYVAILEP